MNYPLLNAAVWFSLHLLSCVMGIWVVSSLLPWALLFMGFGAGMYTLLLDTRSGIARHGVSMCSALENSASSSPEWFCHELHSDHVESECF